MEVAEDAEEKMRQKLEARKAAVEGTESVTTDSIAANELPGREGVQLPVETTAVPQMEEDIPITPPSDPTPEPTSLEPSTLPSSSSSVTETPEESKVGQVFRMDDDDEVNNTTYRSPATSFEGQDGAGATSVVPPGGSMAQEVRRRFKFLCPQDQKTTVKRECQVAAKREEALIAQLQRTIAVYSEALELSRVCERLPDGLGSTLSHQDALKYEERIKFLRGTIAVLEAEPSVSLPKLSALEQTKGLVFACYAQTASGVKGMGDELGLSQPIAEQANAAALGVRGALERITTGRNSESFTNSQPVDGPLEEFIAPNPSSTTGPPVGATTF